MRLIVGWVLFSAFALCFATYQIDLDWDEFNGECNGFLNGTIENQFVSLNGVSQSSHLNGAVTSLGEGSSFPVKQTFLIESENGYITFWIKDKFTDQDMNPDMNRIAQAMPQVSVFHNQKLIKQIKIPQGSGLACKVFTLDLNTKQLDKEIRYFPKSRIFIGKTVNAIDGEPLENVSITLTNNIREVAQLETSKDGFFLFDADLGESNLNFSKEGFISSSIIGRMDIDETPREIICALSPESQEYRIVLTWGNRPEDLDAHLSGPNPDGGDFHIWYRNKTLIDGRDFLDRDDMDKYGPETMTIYKPADGEYLYSIHDYSNRNQIDSRKLSYSGAIVQVYSNNTLINSFQIPQNKKGNCWHVFRLDENRSIIPINKIQFISNEKDIHNKEEL